MKLGELYTLMNDRSLNFQDVEFKYGVIPDKSVCIAFDNFRTCSFLVTYNEEQILIRFTHNKNWERELASFLKLKQDLITRVSLDGLKVRTTAIGEIEEESLEKIRCEVRRIFIENNKNILV